ncbi:MAG: UDP-3-O-(3-hydroxymyristoyl)glucosamine N-acyltransferase [Rubellimicrobium sp.]|nr:UDP-3-O-(3-hydroxymyristoyl)glucosamine N-acyltransferase [Rubellimicrobium sp.]
MSGTAGAGWRLAEVAAALGAGCEGAGDLIVTGAAEPATAGPDDLAIALSPAWAEALGRGRARAALLWAGADWRALRLQGAILVPRGRLAMAHLTRFMDPGPGFAPGIHPSAVVEGGGEVPPDAAIGAFSVIGAGARIGAGVRIGPQVTVAPGAVIGAGCLIHAGCRIGPRVAIGARTILHPGAVIGADGFSFVTAEPSRAEIARARLGAGPDMPAPEDARWHRIHSLGGVEIGEDVEIGANSCVDAGTIRPTRIGRGTRIDNLSQVGHNVVIGEDCLFAAQAAIAGSTVIGNRVVAGGKCGIADNLTLGDDVVLGGATIVLANVPAGRVMMGYPAMPMAAQIESYKALRRLPRILRRIAGAADRSVSKSGGTD